MPFYSESKILFLLYLVSSSTRGSTNIYRAWVHPTLSENEAEIDIAINKFKSKTVQTIKQWVTTGLQRLGKSNIWSFFFPLSTSNKTKSKTKVHLNKDNFYQEVSSRKPRSVEAED